VAQLIIDCTQLTGGTSNVQSKTGLADTAKEKKMNQILFRVTLYCIVLVLYCTVLYMYRVGRC
jgi:hypothetical protein